MELSATAFWMQVMQKLNEHQDLYQPVPEILEDLCTYFGYGCAFVYQADHTGTFHLEDSYAKYQNNHLRPAIDLAQEIGENGVQQLVAIGAVGFAADDDMTRLESDLCRLFKAKSLVLVPIADQNNVLIAMVGFVDRRGRQVLDEEDMALAHSVLTTLANHVKLEMYQNRAEATQRSLENILDHMGVDIYVNDYRTHEILYVNRSMAQPYGGKENMIGKLCWQALYDDKTTQCEYCPQPRLIDTEGNPTKIYSWDYQRPFDGSWFRVLSAAFRWVDGRLAHVVSSVDITENKRNEALVRQMAEYDALTGLPNRRSLLQDCAQLLDGDSEPPAEIFLLFFDLDGFKSINDTMGHRAGDELLQLVGRILQENTLTNGKAYRHSGDEFVILCAAHTLDDVLEVIAFLRENFEKKHRLHDGEVACSASVGVAHFPHDGTEIAGLLHVADHAMYHSKRTGEGLVHFYNRGKPCTPGEYAAGAPARQH